MVFIYELSNQHTGRNHTPPPSPPSSPSYTMFNALSTKSNAFILHFAPTVRVAGETLIGSVDLHLSRAHEENIQQVRVKLRGSISTYALPAHSSHG